MLLPQERALLEQVFTHGRPAVWVAELTNQPVRTVRRRIKKLIVRISRREFDAVVAHSATWPPDMLAIGSAVFVRGLSIRDASREAGIPYREGLVHAKAIRVFARTLGKRSARGEAA